MESFRYNKFSMALHWVTAILVVTLFSLAHIWDFFPHNGPEQRTLQTAHVSLGVVLAVVVILRLIWRVVSRRHIPPALQGFEGLAARAMHYSLYILLLAMMVAGFGKRWLGIMAWNSSGSVFLLRWQLIPHGGEISTLSTTGAHGSLLHLPDFMQQPRYTIILYGTMMCCDACCLRNDRPRRHILYGIEIKSFWTL